jgi:hypothetical protein
MRLYLYLAKRDRTNIQVVSVINSINKIDATRLENASYLNLPKDKVDILQQFFCEHKMDWEPWIETASDYKDLKNRLEKRGYKNISSSCKPLHPINRHLIESKFPVRPSMLRRASP